MNATATRTVRLSRLDKLLLELHIEHAAATIEELTPGQVRSIKMWYWSPVGRVFGERKELVRAQQLVIEALEAAGFEDYAGRVSEVVDGTAGRLYAGRELRAVSVVVLWRTLGVVAPLFDVEPSVCDALVDPYERLTPVAQ